MSTPTLFDAVADGEAGMAQVDENADDRWRRMADDAIRALAETGRPFIGDDVLELLEVMDAPEVHDLRALGPAFIRAARSGVIRKVGTYRPSVRSHGTGKPEWVGTR